MTNKHSNAPDELRARALDLLQQALAILDELGLSAPAARLDYVIAEVRMTEQIHTQH